MQNLILALVPASPPIEAAYSTLGGTDGPDLSRYFIVCGILLAVIAGVAFGLRKLIAGSFKTRAAQRTLHVIDVLSLGGRQKLAVVRCYDRTFVLGLGEKEISPIAELDPVIGANVKAQAPRKSDEEAFAKALGKIQESMPQKQIVTELLEAQDRVSPGLAKKIAQARGSQDPAPAPAPVQPTPPATESQPVPKQRVQKKRVRRKVAKKTQPSQSPRQLEAHAVASAALDLVASKRQARSKTTEASTPQAKPASPASPTNSDTNTEPPILRLEGILG